MIGQWSTWRFFFQWLQFRSPAGIVPKKSTPCWYGRAMKDDKGLFKLRCSGSDSGRSPPKKGHFRNWEVSERRFFNLFTFCYPCTQKFVEFTPPFVKKLTSISGPRKMKKTLSYLEPRKRTWLVVPTKIKSTTMPVIKPGRPGDAKCKKCTTAREPQKAYPSIKENWSFTFPEDIIGKEF